MKVTEVFLVLSQRGADRSRPDLNEETFRAVSSVLLCLIELRDSSLKASDARTDGGELRLLQQEVTGPFQLRDPNPFLYLIKSPRQCLSTEVLKLSELMAAVTSEVLPSLLREHLEAERCVKALQDCLDMVRLTCTPLCCQLSQQLDLPCQHQVRNTPGTC